MNTSHHLIHGQHAIIHVNTGLEYKDECRLMRTLFDNVHILVQNREVCYMIKVKNIEEISKRSRSLSINKILYIKSNAHHVVEIFDTHMRLLGRLESSKKPYGNTFRDMNTAEYFKIVKVA